MILAEHDGALVGPLITAWDGWRGNFYRLALHSDRRRQRIATQTLAEGEHRLTGQGIGHRQRNHQVGVEFREGKT